jgi:tetratricopeptide (TPR) repeat protein
MSSPAYIAHAFCITIVVSCSSGGAPTIEEANLLRNKGDLDSSLALYDQILQQQPNSARAHNGRGFVKKQLGDTIGALNDYSRAIELDSTLGSAYNNRGVLLDCIGKHDQGIRDLEMAVSLDSADPMPLFNLAGCRIHAKQYDQALQDLEHYRNMVGEDIDPRTYYNEAYAYAALDSFVRAEALFTEYMKRDPNGCAFSECAINRAINRIELGMYDSAYSTLKQIETEGGADYEVLYHQGFALERLHRYTDAIQAYERALDYDSTDCCTYWSLGECKEKVGDYQGACAAYHKGLGLGHKDPSNAAQRVCNLQ